MLRIRADAAAGTISLMQTTRADKGKGKLKTDDEFERERQWVVHGLPRYERLKRRRLEAQTQLEEEVASGAFFECGCCFSDTAISQMSESRANAPFLPSLAHLISFRYRSHVLRRLSILSRVRARQRGERDRTPQVRLEVYVDGWLFGHVPRVGTGQMPIEQNARGAAQDQAGEGGR